MKKHLPLLLLLGAMAEPCLAETRLADTIITASRAEQDSSSSVYSHSVIERETIDRSAARDISELLRRLPGVQIGRNGGPGQATSIFIRGAASDHSLILIDGVPAQSGTSGAAAIQHIDPASIERVEVVRGPASTLYGSSAIGGVIQIFTRKHGDRASSLRGGLQAGNQGSLHMTSGVSGKSDDLSMSVQLSHQQTDGFSPKRGLIIDRGYRNSTLNIGGTYELAPDMLIEASHWQSQGNVEYLDFFNAPVDQDVRNSISRIAFETLPTDLWESRIQLSRAIDNAEENQSSDFAHTTRLSGDWQNTFFASEHHTLVGGLTWIKEKAKLLSFGTGYAETSRSSEVYILDRYQRDGLDLQAGGRAIDHSNYGSHFTWNLGAGYQLTPGTRVHANAGTAFRSPSANDLYGFGGNPEFKPEKSRSLEIGLRQRLGSRHSISMNLFHTRMTDLIEVDPSTFLTTQVEKARIRGIEIGYQWRYRPWHLDLDYTWQDPENLDQNTSLARRAENKLDLRMGFEHGPWWSEARLSAESERLDSRFSNVVLDEYMTVDLGLGYQLDRRWNTQLDVQNLFDQDYELAGGYQAQGRLIMVGLRYESR